jgi:hypothetical protein
MFPQKNNAQTFTGNNDVILSHVELLPPVKRQEADGNFHQVHRTPHRTRENLRKR